MIVATSYAAQAPARNHNSQFRKIEMSVRIAIAKTRQFKRSADTFSDEASPRPDEDSYSKPPLFRGVRVCMNGRWATNSQITEMLAKGAERADRFRSEGLLPLRSN